MTKVKRVVGRTVEYMDMPRVMEVDGFWYGPEMADIGDALRGKGKKGVGYDGVVT